MVSVDGPRCSLQCGGHHGVMCALPGRNYPDSRTAASHQLPVEQGLLWFHAPTPALFLPVVRSQSWVEAGEAKPGFLADAHEPLALLPPLLPGAKPRAFTNCLH